MNDVSQLVAQAKRDTEAAKADLLRTFAFVPDDKLTWSPSPTARSAIQIVAHCGLANSAFSGLLRGEPLPLPADPAEAAAQIRAAGRDVASREEAVRLVEDGTARVIAAVDRVTPEMVATTPDSPFGPLPFPVWMTISALHMGGHARQVDYIQTVWGDVDDH